MCRSRLAQSSKSSISGEIRATVSCTDCPPKLRKCCTRLQAGGMTSQRACITGDRHSISLGEDDVRAIERECLFQTSWSIISATYPLGYLAMRLGRLPQWPPCSLKWTCIQLEMGKEEKRHWILGMCNEAGWGQVGDEGDHERTLQLMGEDVETIGTPF